MWIQMGHTCAGMFDFLEAFLTPDAYDYCAAIFVTDVMADPLATASSLEVGIPADLSIQ